MVNVDPGGNQQAHGFNMAALTRGNQRGAAVTVGAFQVRAMGQRQLEDVVVTTGTRQQIGAVVHQVFLIDVGTRRY